LKKKLSAILVFCLILSLLATTASAGGTENPDILSGSQPVAAPLAASDSNKLVLYTSNLYFSDYVSQHQSQVSPNSANVAIDVDVFQYSQATDVEKYDDYLGQAGLLTTAGSTAEYILNVPETGLYNLQVVYSATEVGSADPERILLINGELPYKEAGALTFRRLWKSSSAIQTDPRGNDVRPTQITYPGWQTQVVYDSRGFYEQPLAFFLEKGENRIELVGSRDELMIHSIKFLVVKDAPAYQQVYADWQQKGYQPADSAMITIQGEDTAYTNSATLYPINDRASPIVDPYKGAKIAMNAIGGYNWRDPGQTITWNLHVDKAGLYQIALKEKQNVTSGKRSYRKLMIDQAVPFKEAEKFSFPYDNRWKNSLLSDENGNPYWFYLDAGDHEISLEIVLGALGGIIREIEDSLAKLNATYRDILVITGTTPDAYRDYNLDTALPNIMVVFKSESDHLTDLASRLAAESKTKTPETAIINNMAVQLASFYRKPETIARRLASFKSNLAGLASLTLTLGQQPLTMDKIMVGQLAGKMPPADANFFQQAAHEIRVFVASFSEDYQTIGSVANAGNKVNLWMVTGRDQAQVVKQMAEEMLSPQTGISLNIKLVQSGNLLPSVLSGNNPDVAIQVGIADPINYAIRGALVDLARLSGFDEVTQRFMPSAMVPYTLNGQTFALPETQQFLLMFYRKDILDQLGIALPQTWDDVIIALNKLQKNNLEIGLPYSAVSSSYTSYGTLNGGMLTYTMLLLQQGGQLYRDNGKVSNLDSELSIEVFKKWTDFYTSYNIPLTYDFANRFRLGEMPLAIVDYTAYNMLSVFAPEIKGLWGFAEVPGTVREDGTIDRSVTFTGSSCIMFKHNQNIDASWEFMKWWTSAEVQARYGREMENLLGASARYPTANLEALAMLPWSTSEYEVIRSQLDWVKGTPEVPGGYFTPRHIDNAFRSVVLKTPPANAREALLDYVQYINEELKNKQIEFGLR
jgi:ABC-type glycerol-3-phosphate transport system substrate-binding protein